MQRLSFGSDSAVERLGIARDEQEVGIHDDDLRRQAPARTPVGIRGLTVAVRDRWGCVEWNEESPGLSGFDQKFLPVSAATCATLIALLGIGAVMTAGEIEDELIDRIDARRHLSPAMLLEAIDELDNASLRHLAREVDAGSLEGDALGKAIAEQLLVAMTEDAATRLREAPPVSGTFETGEMDTEFDPPAEPFSEHAVCDDLAPNIVPIRSPKLQITIRTTNDHRRRIVG